MVARKRMQRSVGKKMTIFFANPNVDTEKVRETIEDNLGVQILQIDSGTFKRNKEWD